MTTYLPDVNVLIALVDPSHVDHKLAHAWFANQGRQAFATCPLTENGLLRIVGHGRYPNSPGTPAAAATLLHGVRSLPGHSFWPDDISLLDSAHSDVSLLLNASQVTDSYLLALARAHGGKLATFDRRLAVAAVHGGAQSLHLI